MRLSSLPVLAIRALDRWAGFTARRGEAAYATSAPRLAARLRRRIVADVVALAPGSIVDIGSGPGALTVEIARQLPGASVIGIDPNPRMQALAERLATPANVAFRDGRAERLPLPDASAELVVSALSAHHWNDLTAAVREIRRVLAAGGSARIYDVRFATYTEDELARVARELELPPGTLRRTVPAGQGRLAPFALIEVAA